MSVTAAEGFVAAGCHAGIKRRKFDMAMIATDDRRGGELVLGEHRRALDRPPVVGRDPRHVELAPLDPGMTAGRDEPLGRGYAHG
jgi:hypothetical protein